MADIFFEEEGSRLLTANAFEFVLDGEMKRAVRSQNYLTLVALETRREWTRSAIHDVRAWMQGVVDLFGVKVEDVDARIGERPRDVAIEPDDATLDEVARIVGHEVRDTDLLGSTEAGVLSVVLLDADYDNATRVIDRLVQRIDHYEFTTPLRISVGAACYPTHAVDPDSLKQQALSHPVVNWRGGYHPRSRTRL